MKSNVRKTKNLDPQSVPKATTNALNPSYRYTTLDGLETASINSKHQAYNNHLNSRLREMYFTQYKKSKEMNHFTVYDSYEPLRQTAQVEKDFIDDQDSVYGPGIIPNIMRNIMSFRDSTFSWLNSNSVFKAFGVSASMFLFEHLTWDSISHLSTIFKNDLQNQLPVNINVLNVDIHATEDNRGIDVSVLYIDETENYWKEGPQTIGERVATFTLGIKGS